MSFCLVFFFFFFPEGMWKGFSGLCTWFLYTWTRMAFRLGCVCGGWGQGLLLGPSPRIPSLRRGAPGLRIPPPWALTPSGGNSGRRSQAQAHSLPSPCPQSGMTGEVADRFPGQHRGRLGWSSGHQGRDRVLSSPPHPISLGPPPSLSLHPLVLQISRPLVFRSPEAWTALVAATPSAQW